MRLAEMSLQELIDNSGKVCSCGKIHSCSLRYVVLGHDAVKQTPEILRKCGITKPFIVCDENTRKAAVGKVVSALDGAGMSYTLFSLGEGRIVPDENAVGALSMAFDATCDGVLAVGSGVINDCSKILAHTACLPQVVVGTAPSMDGYASASASMVQNRVKVSLNVSAPKAIIADTAIMKDAPMKMLQAGFGDMVAKYCSICEWRISHIITGEDYCAEIAEMVRTALRKVTANVEKLAQRDEEAVGNVVGGLILTGIAMAFEGLSRPASGEEHYFSHMWEMMDLDRGKESELHGIQVGVGTILTCRVFDWLKACAPSRAVAEEKMRNFNEEDWRHEMHRIFGKAADAIIRGEEEKWHKNSPEHHAQRLNKILDNWSTIVQIADDELPDTRELRRQMALLGEPVLPGEIGVSQQDVEDAWTGSREIRDKYLCSSMAWDLGVMEDAKAALLGE